jgi:hypothetical protein
MAELALHLLDIPDKKMQVNPFSHEVYKIKKV